MKIFSINRQQMTVWG